MKLKSNSYVQAYYMKIKRNSQNLGIYSQVKINFPFDWCAAFTLNESHNTSYEPQYLNLWFGAAMSLPQSKLTWLVLGNHLSL